MEEFKSFMLNRFHYKNSKWKIRGESKNYVLKSREKTCDGYICRDEETKIRGNLTQQEQAKLFEQSNKGQNVKNENASSQNDI